LRTKLAIQYGVIGFVFGVLWISIVLALRSVAGLGWSAGLVSGVICFLVCGPVVMRLFGYLADGTWDTLLSRSSDFSLVEKVLIGYLCFYGFHGAVLGVVAYLLLSFTVTAMELSETVPIWYLGSGILWLVPAAYYGWTEVE
jgi:hypothetical protein